MKEISLRKIDETNIQDIHNVFLKPNQTAFIETVDKCLEEAKEYPAW